MKRTTAVSSSAWQPTAEIFLDEAGLYLPNGPAQRLRGAYYTPGSVADYMADWAVRHDGEHVLEPSFGDGIFLRALAASAEHREFNAVRLTGVEIDEKAGARALHEHLVENGDLRCEDFLGVSPFKVQAVIGNPPYVRLRHLLHDQQQRALRAAEIAMAQPMDPAGSLWMPFVLHAMRFLDEGGRLAFVLPYDFTYVRYAQPLWSALRDKFGSLRVLRTRERLFPELLQDVVILLADNYGSRTSAVRYQTFERVLDLLNARPTLDDTLDIDDLLRGERVFVSSLLGHELRCLLRTRVADTTVQARKLVTFNIGYIAADKVFFHPTESEVHDYKLPSRSLRPAVTSTRMLKGAGLRTSSLGTASIGKLFLPDPAALTDGERRYIAMGAESGVSNRYKCRVRNPWFVVPGIRVPDVILSVFSERPILLVNDAGYFASNSLLCGFSVATTKEEIATSWYTSLTLLQCELEVHALGGGVMIMVPKEAGNIRLPERVAVNEEHINRIDHLLRLGRTKEAYRAGDLGVLSGQLGFREHEVDLIHEGIEVLTHWRTSARSSFEDFPE